MVDVTSPSRRLSYKKRKFKYFLLNVRLLKRNDFTNPSRKLVKKRTTEESGLSTEYEYSFSLEDMDTF